MSVIFHPCFIYTRYYFLVHVLLVFYVSSKRKAQINRHDNICWWCRTRQYTSEWTKWVIIMYRKNNSHKNYQIMHEMNKELLPWISRQTKNLYTFKACLLFKGLESIQSHVPRLNKRFDTSLRRNQDNIIDVFFLLIGDLIKDN